MSTARNVLGTPLTTCSTEPLTGWRRNGCCDSGPGDTGMHILCAVMTASFLAFSREAGNDLSTPRPEYGFPGLQPGDRWCLCVSRWVEADHAEVAPPVVLEATHISTLEFVELNRLKEMAHEPPGD